MKKFITIVILVCALLVPHFSGKTLHADILNSEYGSLIVITNIEKVYTSTDQNVVIASLPFNTHLIRCDLLNYMFVEGGNIFYKVRVNVGDAEQEGYILATHTISSDTVGIVSVLDTNAKLNDDCILYVLTGEEYVDSGMPPLPAGERVRVLDGQKKSGYNQIVVEQNGQMINYYVPADAVDLDGINRNAILAIFLLVTCISLVLVLFGTTIKKKKKGSK